MPSQENESFKQVWPRCFIIFLGIIELLVVVVFVLTELGNIGTNFWLTNVFAGSWCGLIILVHLLALFVSGCCSPTPSAAFGGVIITVIALIACAALISFNAVFIAQPSTCILTSSCNANSVSTTIFSYSFQQNFYTVFNGLNPFQNYTQSQAKFLFQTIQLGVGCLCFILCLIYLIIYFVTKSKASKRITPMQQQGYRAPQLAYNQPAYNQPAYSEPAYRQPKPNYRPTPRAPQAVPGELPWNANRY